MLQVAFADEACMPKHARFAHAAAPINAFEPLGEIRLQARILEAASLDLEVWQDTGPSCLASRITLLYLFAYFACRPL